MYQTTYKPTYKVFNSSSYYLQSSTNFNSIYIIHNNNPEVICLDNVSKHWCYTFIFAACK